jgi:hypothetical protein
LHNFEWFARRQIPRVPGQAFLKNRQQLHGKTFSAILKKVLIPSRALCKKRVRRMYKHPNRFSQFTRGAAPLNFKNQENQSE